MLDPVPHPTGPFDPTIPFREAKRRAMEQWERWYVLTLLDYTHGNLSRASRVAQTDRTYLRKLLRRYTTESDTTESDTTESGTQGSVMSAHTGQ